MIVLFPTQQIPVTDQHLHRDVERKRDRRRGQSWNHSQPPTVLRQPVLWLNASSHASSSCQYSVVVTIFKRRKKKHILTGKVSFLLFFPSHCSSCPQICYSFIPRKTDRFRVLPMKDLEVKIFTFVHPLGVLKRCKDVSAGAESNLIQVLVTCTMFLLVILVIVSVFIEKHCSDIHAFIWTETFSFALIVCV